MVSELYGRHAEMGLDILAEEGGVGKAEQVADLLDAQVGLLQIVADVLHHMLGDPLIGRLP